MFVMRVYNAAVDGGGMSPSFADLLCDTRKHEAFRRSKENALEDLSMEGGNATCLLFFSGFVDLISETLREKNLKSS